jgi:hypothetical protein
VVEYTMSGHSPYQSAFRKGSGTICLDRLRQHAQSLACINRALKNRASRRDRALCGFCKCSHINKYAALFKTPHALADGLMLVFEHPAKERPTGDGHPGLE